MKQLDIIIPHHNTPDLLQRCINSIPNMADIQVYIIDDNSNPEIVDFEKFPGKGLNNMHIFFTKEGKGAGYARNIGLQHAKGDWLLFADSDDFFIKDFYQKVSNYFDSDADMILFKAESVDSDTLEPSDRNKKMNGRIDDCLSGKITAKEVSLAGQVPWCRLIRREFVEKNGIRFDEVMASNDTMFTTKASCLAKKILVSPHHIYVVTYRKGSLWDNRKANPENYLTRLRVHIRRNRYVKQFGIKPLPVLGYVFKALSINPVTFFRAFWIAVSEKALFQGVTHYFKK